MWSSWCFVPIHGFLCWMDCLVKTLTAHHQLIMWSIPTYYLAHGQYSIIIVAKHRIIRQRHILTVWDSQLHLIHFNEQLGQKSKPNHLCCKNTECWIFFPLIVILLSQHMCWLQTFPITHVLQLRSFGCNLVYASISPLLIWVGWLLLLLEMLWHLCLNFLMFFCVTLSNQV